MENQDQQPSHVRAEQRWPATVAILVLIAVPLLMPDRLTLGPFWLLPAGEAVLLIAIVLADPGRIDRRSSTMRTVSIALVVLLILSAAWMTAALVGELIEGGGITNSAGQLLAAGTLVWINNNITFALFYWQLDGGGPASRYFEPPAYPDLAFPQHMNPQIAPPGWRPVFIDYLYLGFTNATAFSPTDVMPLSHWAKIAMTVQSLISLAILGLVIARAVNILN